MTTPGRGRRRPWERFDTRVLLLAILTSAPGIALGLILLWMSDWTSQSKWTFTLLIGIFTVGSGLVLRERLIRPLQTIANLLGALREGDFSIRARGARLDDSLGLALWEINTLSETLREQRLGAMEATALLRTVMAEIDVAVLAFDAGGRVRLANRAAELLLGQSAVRLQGQSADELGLTAFLQGEAPRTFTESFPGATGRWELRRIPFRQEGLPHQLVVLSDLSRALREEERDAWQRLVRVLSHEINNSLTPIQSIAGSLQDMLRHSPRAGDWEDDLRQGLGVIHGRSGALARFMAAYARLARLPPPQRRPMQVRDWITRVASLEPRLPVRVVPGPELSIEADGDQLDQMLINLVRNAADASLETRGAVEVGWAISAGRLEVRISDEGRGLPDSPNLFVPFFTTKPNGSGIGLALSRQIAEAHGGTLALANRTDRSGCDARVVLPI